MIQRLQSVYLFGIILLALLTCTGRLIDFHHNPTINSGQTISASQPAITVYSLNAVYLNTYVNNNLASSEIQYILVLLVTLLVGWSLNIIFGYKNRKKQMLHTKINFVLIVLYLTAVIVTAYTRIPDFTFVGMNLKASIGLALIMFMLYLNLRALLLIKKDDNLVKSADRLR